MAAVSSDGNGSDSSGVLESSEAERVRRKLSSLAATCGMDPSTFYGDDSESDSETTDSDSGTTERIPAIPPQWFAQWDIDYAEMQAVARGEGPTLEPEDFQDMRVQAEAYIRLYTQADKIRDLTTAGTPLGEYMSAIARGDA